MPKVCFTYALKRFFPEIRPEEMGGATVAQIVRNLDEKYPGIRGYLVDDQGRLRQHVNIFVDGELIRDRESLSDDASQADEVYIMQALSGG
ncbi:MAG: MoaD/ThiS family protein [Saprospiraceae bacterium]|nr:MoaD/ThiS family protein [Saprospiraceae bacterium]